MPALQRSDADLVAAVADGDRTALEQLHRRHAPWLTARLHHCCTDRGVVGEVRQDRFVAAWRSAGRQERPGRGGYLAVDRRSAVVPLLRTRAGRCWAAASAVVPLLRTRAGRCWAAALAVLAAALADPARARRR